ncbi:MAG: TetR/AcrR family transcriptional regulator C-terminal domain-containing protein [Clostridiales bacterium]|nr:TetR/AcrR family transcriptional regulator C-terminal domain-containing protein [Clostridiales bacterium]
MTNEELSLRTKKALAAALKKAMETKKLSKITVSELIAQCNINRKTFYYHFEDIYALLKWMLEEEAIEVVKQYDMVVNSEEVFRFVMDYVEENKHIINCAYDSMGHEELKRFFYTDFISIFLVAVKNEEDKLGIPLDKSFVEFLARFYTEAATGILIDWIKNRVSQDRETVLQDLLLIYRVSIPTILKAKAAQDEKK